jgi:23S rRNA (pseudouridine1915-N3)-methyltransferase
MISLNFIMVDRTRASYIKEGEEDYLRRIRRFTTYKRTEVKPVKISGGISDEEVIHREGLNILEKIEHGDYLIALDKGGRQYSSEGLASLLRRLSVENRGQICFIIGGPLGLSQEIIKKAHQTLSLSEMTLTHEMVRLVLAEQVYRAFTIIKGHKYHK